MNVNMSWKGREMLYCLNLVANGGDDNVSVSQVVGYLRLQQGSAENDGEDGNALILGDLARVFELPM